MHDKGSASTVHNESYCALLRQYQFEIYQLRTFSASGLIIMALEDFERELAESKEETERHRHHHHHHRSRQDRDDSDRRHHSRRHHSSRHHESRDDEDSHRHKRRRKHSSDNDEPSRRTSGPDEAADEPGEAVEVPQPTGLKRDAWMEAPSALDIDYIQRPKRQASPPKFGSLGADYELKIHEKELNHHLRDLNNGKTVDDLPDNNDEEVSYTFGDSRSGWRMTKLRAVYRQATESKRLVEDVALERYGNLKDFDEDRKSVV